MKEWISETEQIMRKMYIQPKNEVTELEPMNIVCASGGFGETDEMIGGQAPQRKVF